MDPSISLVEVEWVVPTFMVNVISLQALFTNSGVVPSPGVQVIFPAMILFK